MPKRGASHFQGLVFTLNIEKIPCKYHSFDVAHSEAVLTLYITQLKILEYGFVPEQAASWFRSIFVPPSSQQKRKISATCRLSKQSYTKGENIGEELT
jgi:hypothetical protein